MERWAVKACRLVMAAGTLAVAAAVLVESMTSDVRFHRYADAASFVFVVISIILLMRHPRMRELWRVKKHIRTGPSAVPCPGCGYDLFEPIQADQTHTCPECGHTTREDDAIASWDRAMGVRVPAWWVERMRGENQPRTK